MYVYTYSINHVIFVIYWRVITGITPNPPTTPVLVSQLVGGHEALLTGNQWSHWDTNTGVVGGFDVIPLITLRSIASAVANYKQLPPPNLCYVICMCVSQPVHSFILWINDINSVRGTINDSTAAATTKHKEDLNYVVTNSCYMFWGQTVRIHTSMHSHTVQPRSTVWRSSCKSIGPWWRQKQGLSWIIHIKEDWRHLLCWQFEECQRSWQNSGANYACVSHHPQAWMSPAKECWLWPNRAAQHSSNGGLAKVV